MNKHIKYLLLIVVVISSNTYAGWSFTGKVDYVQTHGDGRVTIKMLQDTSGTSCENAKFTLESHESGGAAQAFSIAMAAKVSDRDISIIWDGAGDNCDAFANYHRIYRILLH